MDATTMAKTDLLADIIRRSYPALSFKASDDFLWSAEKNTIYFLATDDEDGVFSLLHETAHALLEHNKYDQDIALLRIERDAWTYAQQELAPQFGLEIDDAIIEDAIDTYRDWLHARSLCPECHQNGIQADNIYRCLGCDKTWRANEAKRCALRRYTLST